MFRSVLIAIRLLGIVVVAMPLLGSVVIAIPLLGGVVTAVQYLLKSIVIAVSVMECCDCSTCWGVL